MTLNPSTDDPWASIIIPTYNEAETIVDVVDEVLRKCWGAGFDVEVLVVDDNSPDQTWWIVHDHFDGDRVQSIRRTQRPGLSQAVLRGFSDARGDVFLVMDGDGQHPPAAVPRVLAPLRRDGIDNGDDVDLVIGSRFTGDGGIAGWSWSRRLVSWGGARLAEASVGRSWPVSDPMSGFFAVRAGLVDDHRADLDPTGYKILLELLGAAKPDTIVEVPYTFEDRRAGESNLSTRESLRFVAHALGLGRRVSMDPVDAAVLAVGGLWLFAAPLPTVANIGAFAAAAAIVVVRSGRGLAADVGDVDVSVADADADGGAGDVDRTGGAT